eukprot:760334-Hanusia_phi.AAC.8
MLSGFLWKSNKSVYTEAEIKATILDMNSQPHDRKAQEKACVYISGLYERTELHKVLFKNGGAEALIAAMKNFPQVPQIQFSALWDLKYLAEDASQRDKLLQLGVIDLIIRAMNSYNEVVMIQQVGIEFLTIVAVSGQEKFCTTSEIFDTVKCAIQKHRGCTDLLYFAMYFLVPLMKIHGATRTFVHKGMLTLVIDIMKTTEGEVEIQGACLTLLATICKGPFIDAILNDADMETIAGTMKRFPQVQRVQAGVWEIIRKCSQSTRFEDIMVRNRTVEDLVEALTEYDQPDLLLYCLDTINILAHFKSVASKLQAARALEIVKNLLDEHPHSVKIQKQGSSFLMVMDSHLRDENLSIRRGEFDPNPSTFGRKSAPKESSKTITKKQPTAESDLENNKVERKVQAEAEKRQNKNAESKPELEKPFDHPTDDTSNGCVICMNAMASHAYIPCGHQCVCLECSTQFHSRCPVCNQDSQMIIKIWQYAA